MKEETSLSACGALCVYDREQTGIVLRRQKITSADSLREAPEKFLGAAGL